MITYEKGDATVPNRDDVVVGIVHICNNAKMWGAGFVVPLGKKYPAAKRSFLSKNLNLGDVDVVKINDNLYIFNVVAQDNLTPHKHPRVSYTHLAEGLFKVNEHAKSLNISVLQMPKIGSIGGGNWEIISSIIEQNLIDTEVVVYELT